MQRYLVGITALVLLAAWIALELLEPDNPAYAPYISVCSKLGTVLAVVWLALPEALQFRNRLWIAMTLISVMVLAWKPKLFPVVAVIFVAMAILRPRSRRPSNQSGASR